MTRLSGKIALVTGASRGIGRGIALRFAAEGALVAVHYGRNQQAAEQVVKEIEQKGGAAFAIGAELSDSSSNASKRNVLPLDQDIKTSIPSAFSQFTGIGLPASIEETTEEMLL